MRRLTFAVLIMALVVGMASGVLAGTVANGTVIETVGGPPFPTVGRFTIDSNGTLTLNVETACPSTAFDLLLACDLFALVSETTGAFTTDATGKFVGQLVGAFNGFQGGCPIPFLFAEGTTGATDCFLTNGF